MMNPRWIIFRHALDTLASGQNIFHHQHPFAHYELAVAAIEDEVAFWRLLGVNR